MAIFGKISDLLKEEEISVTQGAKSSTPVRVAKKPATAEDPETALLSLKAEIDRKLGALQERERLLSEREKGIEERRAKVETLKDELLAKLEKVSTMTKDEARNSILKAWEDKLKEEIAKRIRQSEEYAKQEADKKAKQ